jgi:hypothetical protein
MFSLLTLSNSHAATSAIGASMICVRTVRRRGVGRRRGEGWGGAGRGGAGGGGGGVGRGRWKGTV